jgi:hypothetical protein
VLLNDQDRISVTYCEGEGERSYGRAMRAREGGQEQ